MVYYGVLRTENFAKGLLIYSMHTGFNYMNLKIPMTYSSDTNTHAYTHTHTHTHTHTLTLHTHTQVLG